MGSRRIADYKIGLHKIVLCCCGDWNFISFCSFSFIRYQALSSLLFLPVRCMQARENILFISLIPPLI